MKYSFTVIIACLIFNLFPINVNSRELTDVELFYRCYTQISQQYPQYNDKLSEAVRKNEITPIKACMTLLNSANFNTNTGNSFYYTAPNNSEISDHLALNVLNTFHQLHSSWFAKQTFFATGNSESLLVSTQRLYDISEPALYLLKALFDDTDDITNIFTNTKRLMAYRDNNKPKISRYLGENHYDTSFSIFKDSIHFKYASFGRIKGITIEPNVEWTYRYKAQINTSKVYTSTTTEINTYPNKNLGGGFIGTPAYFHTSFEQSIPFKANGVDKTPRTWAKNIYNDLLCRELPVIRKSDALPYTYSKSESNHEFRYNKNCVQCHASMDPLSYVVRNIRPYELAVSNLSDPFLGYIGFEKTPISSDSNVINRTPASIKAQRLPPKNIENFSELEPNGYLYYRDHKGKLIDIKVSSLSDLGSKASTLDDPYICIAKRYYKYFTGIDVNIGDPENLDLNKTENYHRESVINLGIDLKNHKKPKKLIESILNLKQYKQSDFAFKGIIK